MEQLARGWLLVVALVTALWSIFVLTAAPSVGWLDAGELVAGAWDLGVSHPPGQPLPTLLWRLVMLLPIGSIAYRATVLSCLFAAGCVWPLWLLLRPLVDGLQRPLRLPVVGMAVVASLLGFAPWTQAVRSELYALQLFLALSVLAYLAEVLRTQTGSQARALVMMTALFGLSCATHPLLAAGLLPAVVLGLIGARRRGRLVGLPWGGVALVLAASLYLYLPLRSLASPELAWGLPHSLSGFVDVITGRAFTHNFAGDDGGTWLANLGLLGGVLIRDVSPALCLLAPLGLIAVWIAGSRMLAAVAAVAVVGNLATVAFQNKVFTTNPDLHGYLALSIVLLALMGVCGVALAFGLLARRARLTVSLGAAWASVGVLLLAALAVGMQVNLAPNWLPEMAARARIDALPPGTVVLTSGNSSAFVGWYLERIERRRPDLRSYHRVLLGHPHYERYLESRDARMGTHLDSAAMRADAREALRGSDPAAVEIRPPDLAHGDTLIPAGRMMWLTRAPRDSATIQQRHLQLRARWGPHPDDPVFVRDGEAVQVHLYERVLRASFHASVGQESELLEELQAIEAMAPGFVVDLVEPADASWWRDR